jgi:hypothetical protein
VPPYEERTCLDVRLKRGSSVGPEGRVHNRDLTLHNRDMNKIIHDVLYSRT